MKLVIKKLLIAFILLLLLPWSTGPVAAQGEVPYDPYDLYIFPSVISPAWFQVSPFINDVYRPEALSAPGTAIDQNGIMYYVVSDRDKMLTNTQIYQWDDLLQPYEFWIIGITAQGERFMFAWGTLPLKSSIAGISFNPVSSYEDIMDGRLILFIKTLELDTTACPFLVPLDVPAVLPQKALNQTSSTGAWDLSALDSCFRENLSMLQIMGYFKRLPEFAGGFIF